VVGAGLLSSRRELTSIPRDCHLINPLDLSRPWHVETGRCSWKVRAAKRELRDGTMGLLTAGRDAAGCVGSGRVAGGNERRRMSKIEGILSG